MKQLAYFLIVFFAVVQCATGQNQWAWMHGDKSPNQISNYGTRGMAAASNIPGSRIGAATWTDTDGNFWLFGGNGKGESARSGYLNDLWKYSPATGMWTWMGGNKTTNNTGTYNSKGSASVNNLPGARMNAVTWTDSRGNFWLFGGQGMASSTEKPNENTGGTGNGGGGTPGTGGNDNHNDGDHDNKGEGDNGNNGHHGEGNDGKGKGNGGSGRDGKHAELESDDGLLNDLWMYSPSTNQWTWISGKDKLNEKGEYGRIAEANAANVPGARAQASGWTDNNGNLWLFGGSGYTSKPVISALNDIWKYSISNNEWTWMNGSKNGNDVAHFGDKGTFAADNLPRGRHGSATWTGSDGSFWMFGGGTHTELYADLWKFNPQNNKWAWISGSKDADHAPAFKGKGLPDKDGNPGARIMSSGWIDASGNLWLFGGSGYGRQTGTSFVNNMWMYDIATDEWTFVKGDAAVLSSPDYGNKGQMSNAANPAGTANYASWKDKQGNFWLFGGQSSAGFLNQTWKFAACVGNVSGTISPATASLCGNGSQQLTASGGSSYQWLLNDELLEGETNPTINVTKTGAYSVIISNGGCTGKATNSVVVSNSSVAGVRYNDVFVSANTPVQLNARQIGVSYDWTPTIGLNNPSSPTPLVTATTDREYIVNITTGEGCTTSDTVLVKIGTGDKKAIVVPTAFTPDGNGVNDVLRPLGNLVSLDYFRVFNRWGAMLYQTSEWGAGWDGRYKGLAQPAETYTWMLSGKTADGQTLKLSGKTLLIR
jgi:gliding motility-associated-like protein